MLWILPFGVVLDKDVYCEFVRNFIGGFIETALPCMVR